MKLLQFRISRSDFEREQLIESHMYLVEIVARRIKAKLPPSFELDDLMAEGYLALIHAADTWDEQRGPFKPRAHYIIGMKIIDSVRRKRYTANTLTSLSTPVPGTEGLTMNDVVIDGDSESSNIIESKMVDSIDDQRRMHLVRNSIAKLRPRHRRVAEICYTEGRDMVAAARELGIHASRISQIHHAALRRICGELETSGGASYKVAANRIRKLQTPKRRKAA